MITRLLVEGPDDKNVVSHLLIRNGFTFKTNDRIAVQLIGNDDSILEIKDKGGFSNLITTLKQELAASDLSGLGIIVDADASLSDRWQNLRDGLRPCGYTSIPGLPSNAGTVIAGVDTAAVGVWIMPDNTLDGVLEDFVAGLVPDGDSLWPRAQQAVRDIPSDLRRCPATAKAEIHTWLAWQEEPGARLGSAINRQYLRSDTPTALTLVAWVNRLCAA